ncbi:rhodanese-like domain-containing protein [Sediminihaliea albiluteola]|nr:rhodanese-like domain-containing protein [Sediminihaliea albiluteola]
MQKALASSILASALVLSRTGTHPKAIFPMILNLKALRRTAAMAAALFAMTLNSSSAMAQSATEPLWIDVRSPAEYRQGHLEGAALIPFDAIEKGVTEMRLDKDRPIYLYCAVGARAEKARRALVKQGYTQVVNAGGLKEAEQMANCQQSANKDHC